jgi:biopolymer transport protein ExbD
MAGFGSSKPSAPITGINVTPLVDITLVLLIIFMVTAKLVVSRAMPMDLPKAASGGEVQQIFALALRAEGSTYVDGVVILNDEELLARARRALADHPELRAVVQADGVVPHSRVMHALDILRQAGLSHVAFGVEPGPTVESASSANKPAAARAAPAGTAP